MKKKGCILMGIFIFVFGSLTAFSAAEKNQSLNRNLLQQAETYAERGQKLEVSSTYYGALTEYENAARIADQALQALDSNAVPFAQRQVSLYSILGAAHFDAARIQFKLNQDPTSHLERALAMLNTAVDLQDAQNKANNTSIHLSHVYNTRNRVSGYLYFIKGDLPAARKEFEMLKLVGFNSSETAAMLAAIKQGERNKFVKEAKKWIPVALQLLAKVPAIQTLGPLINALLRT